MFEYRKQERRISTNSLPKKGVVFYTLSNTLFNIILDTRVIRKVEQKNSTRGMIRLKWVFSLKSGKDEFSIFFFDQSRSSASSERFESCTLPMQEKLPRVTLEFPRWNLQVPLLQPHALPFASLCLKM